MGDLERALRQHSDATDVLREYLRFQSPAYYRSCHVVRTPLTLARKLRIRARDDPSRDPAHQ